MFNSLLTLQRLTYEIIACFYKQKSLLILYTKKVCICVYCWVSYLIHQSIMAQIIWYSDNMEGKPTQFYSETQTEQKYAIWCRCWYLYGQKVMKFWCLCNVNQWDLYNSIYIYGKKLDLWFWKLIKGSFCVLNAVTLCKRITLFK